jgi:transposase
MNKSNEQRHKERQERTDLSVKLYKKGLTIPQIAKKIKVSESTVENYLSKKGIKLDETPKISKPQSKPQITTKVKLKKTKKGPSGNQLILLSIITLCLLLILVFF